MTQISLKFINKPTKQYLQQYLWFIEGNEIYDIEIFVSTPFNVINFLS